MITYMITYMRRNQPMYRKEDYLFKRIRRNDGVFPLKYYIPEIDIVVTDAKR